MTRTHDVLVIGAGFGGLGSALRLAEHGVDVVLCEALGYPGGCACTFKRNGHKYEAGATLFSGLGEGQLFRQWIDRYGLDVEVEWLDPVLTFRAPGYELEIPRARDVLVERFADMPGAPRQAIYNFFAEQKRVADILWSLLDDPVLLPPFDFGGFVRHLGRLPRYLPLARFAGRSVHAILKRHGLATFEPLRLYLDALCQITVQCGIKEAESTVGLATMDYYFRGTGHVRGGIGELAKGLVAAIRQVGGEVRYASPVGKLRRDGAVWVADTPRGEVRARRVVANVLPQALHHLTGEKPFDGLTEEVESGWGACMLYLVARDDVGPRHLQMVLDPTQPLQEGNHLFASRTETITVSTHVRIGRSDMPAVQQKMREGIARMAPEWEIVDEFTASPRTFERWTRRPGGYVGGVPRRAGQIPALRTATPDGLHLVGDSVFPGQSTFAAALGGYKLAQKLSQKLAR
ncbi:MAG: NAD(P)/FAD-dependent oxidoreductase [Planctomycetota bacterium]